jgi:hypothetical protein
VAVKRVAKAVKELIFPKKRFKVGTETHTLEARQSGAGYSIIVHSPAKSIPLVIKDARNFLKNNPDPSLLRKVDKLEKDYTAWPRMKIDTEAARRRKSEAYLAIFQLTMQVMKAIDPGGPVPMSSITWGSLDSRGRATGVFASTLTVKGPKGGTPSETIPGWDTRYEESEIRAHLLHHRIHGPGKRFNLTPTSRSINRRMFEDVEKYALEALGIKPKSTVKQKTVKLSYSTKVTYATSPAPALRDVAKSVEMDAKAKDISTNKIIGSWNMPKTDNY